MKHTPLPWVVHPNGWIFGADGYQIAMVVYDCLKPELYEANTAIIVNSVNSHNALMRALDNLLIHGITCGCNSVGCVVCEGRWVFTKARGGTP